MNVLILNKNKTFSFNFYGKPKLYKVINFYLANNQILDTCNAFTILNQISEYVIFQMDPSQIFELNSLPFSLLHHPLKPIQ